VSYDDEHSHWSRFDRAQTAAADLRIVLSMHGSKDHVRDAIGPNNYARTFEYLDCIDKNLPVLQKHIRLLIQIVEGLARLHQDGKLDIPDGVLVARARLDAGLVDDAHGDTAQQAGHRRHHGGASMKIFGRRAYIFTRALFLAKTLGMPWSSAVRVAWDNAWRPTEKI
jgi:hypothetical protein